MRLSLKEIAKRLAEVPDTKTVGPEWRDKLAELYTALEGVHHRLPVIECWVVLQSFNHFHAGMTFNIAGCRTKREAQEVVKHLRKEIGKEWIKADGITFRVEKGRMIASKVKPANMSAATFVKKEC